LISSLPPARERATMPTKSLISLSRLCFVAPPLALLPLPLSVRYQTRSAISVEGRDRRVAACVRKRQGKRDHHRRRRRRCRRRCSSAWSMPKKQQRKTSSAPSLSFTHSLGLFIASPFAFLKSSFHVLFIAGKESSKRPENKGETRARHLFTSKERSRRKKKNDDDSTHNFLSTQKKKSSKPQQQQPRHQAPRLAGQGRRPQTRQPALSAPRGRGRKRPERDIGRSREQLWRSWSWRRSWRRRRRRRGRRRRRS
jgi:hypothetical protein